MNIFGDKKISFEKRINSLYEDIRDCDKRKLLLDIILITGLFIFGFYVNRGIEMKGLYMDDLYMWSCYGEQSFFEYVFPIGTSTRPELQIFPVRAKTLVPWLSGVPIEANHAPPFVMICAIFAHVSTLLMTVGLPQSPLDAGNGGRG